MKQKSYRRDSDISDFDLVIFADERLDLIEAKAISTPMGLHVAIDKLSKLQSQLSGQSGRAWLVAPLLNREALNSI